MFGVASTLIATSLSLAHSLIRNFACLVHFDSFLVQFVFPRPETYIEAWKIG
ncbi:hypothetical protein Lalb_Chr20g0112501 [Lupinus albus]|uniref:Uncharacterized protein n=1 Tax=Lupinus albus TaxID=3870 RepID=A0A6A4NN33_LUPAL|nr:hypothetical protein Lalb_Chr20g0112501 [Lupinus albus]